MSGFDREWLALREPYDHASRNDGLVAVLNDWLSSHAAGQPVRVMDLGCGAGSNLRYLTPRLPAPQAWRLVDNDPALLDALSHGNRFDPRYHTTLQHDLTDLEGLPFEDCDVIVASALMDLASAEWFSRLAERCRLSGVALLVALDYDGRIEWQPTLPDDHWLEDQFNTHQRGNKGFGPAMGPSATATMSTIFGDLGYSVTTASTPWEFATSDDVIQRELVQGIAGAGLEISPHENERIEAWSKDRIALIDGATSRLLVGHGDLLALPPGSRS